MNTKKVKIETDADGEQYFIHETTTHYIKHIDPRGYDATCFTNAGYFGGFKLIDIEYDIDDYAILELI